MSCRARFSRTWLRLLATLAALLLAGTVAAAGSAPEIELFVRSGCPHCAAAKAYLAELAAQRPGLRIVETDLQRDPGARARLARLSRDAGIAQPGVPTIRVGERLIVGFDSPATTGAQVLAALDGRAPASAAASSCSMRDELSCGLPDEAAIELPFGGGRLSVADVGLPLFTVAIGLLDGFNPCSMWVLILMISMLATLGNRRKMLLIAGTFVAIEGLAYFAFMAAWLNLFLLIGLSRASEIAIAALALVAGAVNLKDFVAFGRGVSLSIPAAAKPGIYARLRAILHANRLAPALFGVAVLAIMMQAVELLCTSGFPALYTRILTLRQLDSGSYYGYLLLYNAMYMLDDVIVLGIGVVTLSQHRLQEHEGRLLKLVSGFVMVGLGIYLLLSR